MVISKGIPTYEEKLIEELGYDDHFHDHHDGDKFSSNFINTYIFSMDHKMIAKQFLITGMFWAIIGALMILIFINSKFKNLFEYENENLNCNYSA